MPIFVIQLRILIQQSMGISFPLCNIYQMHLLKVGLYEMGLADRMASMVRKIATTRERHLVIILYYKLTFLDFTYFFYKNKK